MADLQAFAQHSLGWLRVLPRFSLAAWGLAGLVAINGLVRWQFLDVPLERDEGEFAYGGRLLLEGELPYQSLYAMKFPGIYLVYAIIQAACGSTVRGIHLGLLWVNLATLVVLFLFVRKLFDATTALVAAAIFAILSFSASAVGALAQAEHFVILPALAGALCLALAIERSRGALFFASGVLFGVALLIKQHGAAFLLFAIAFTAINQFSGWKREPATRLRQLFLLVAGASAPIALTCMILAFAGVWKPFVFWTVTYAQEYLQHEPLERGWSNLKNEVRHQLSWSEPIWCCALAGMALLVCARRWRPGRRFTLTWLGASCLAILPGYYFRPHYFLFLYPSVAILAAIALVTLGQELARWRGGRLLGAGATILVLGWCTFEQLAFAWPLSAVELSRAYYPTVFPDAPQIGATIAAHTRPEDRVAILGSEPELLFYANRRSATGHVYMYPLMEPQPFARRMQLDAIREIEEASPAVIVVCEFEDSWLLEANSSTRILDWVREYVPSRYKLVARFELFANQPPRICQTPDLLATPPTSSSLVYVMRRRDDSLATAAPANAASSDQTTR